jgi:heavy metal sensor kinase
MRFRPRYVRDRLTVRFVFVFGLVLGAYICGATFLLFWQLTSQLYHAEIQDVETAEGLLYFTPHAEIALHEEYHNRAKDRLLLDRLMEVLTPEGQVLFRNEKLGGRDLGGKPIPEEGRAGYDERSIRLSDGTQVLVISHVHSIQGRPLLIRLAYSTEPLTHRIEEFIGLLLLALPVALVVSGFAGYRMAGRALAPLAEMVGQTEQITAHRLHDRIPIENPGDELGQMARVLNGLFQRLEESFGQLKRFTSDVSHELRTPLASIRSVGEVGLQREHSAEAYRDIIGSMLEEVSRLTHMVDTLLTIARADAGQIELHMTVFPLMNLVREVVGVVGILAEEKKQMIVLSGDETIQIHGDRTFLRQAVMNLLDNAVKYSPIESEIRLHAKRLPTELYRPNMAELTIEDQGPGISEEAGARVFDRFYRIDDARSRDAGGAGLGLSIAKWVIEVHSGEIGLKANRGKGCMFYVRIPFLESAVEAGL